MLPTWLGLQCAQRKLSNAEMKNTWISSLAQIGTMKDGLREQDNSVNTMWVASVGEIV